MLVSDLIILSGLPGSGKTRYAKKLEKENPGTQVFSLDNNPSPFKDFDEYADIYVIDGLILTNNDIINVINEFDKNASGIWSLRKLEIHHWLEDREACLINDSTRPKERSAAITIKSAPFEYPDMEKILRGIRFKEISECIIVEETVYNPETKINSLINILGDKIESDEWCTGGSWADYKGNRGELEIENPPSEFKKLEEILDEVTPEMTRKDYKEILKLVTTKERFEHDYYGGVGQYSRFEIDTKILFRKLDDLGYEYENDKE